MENGDSTQSLSSWAKRSMSDTLSQTIQSDHHEPPPVKSQSKAIAATDSQQPPTHNHQKRSSPPPPPVLVLNRSVREEFAAGVRTAGEEELGGDGGWRTKEVIVRRRAELGFRVSEMILCLISFSVMAADKTQGWTGDSFYRYKEYRYCAAVNVIGVVYSGFQAFSLAYNLGTRKHIISHHLRYHFDFSMDQILAYLLISASSSAATRVEDWVSNWGKDEFTEMASVSISISFLAFVAFALSSIISGYNLCKSNIT